MRTKSAQATAVLANPSHSARAIVRVTSSDGGTETELSAAELFGFEPVLSVSVEHSIDAFRTARVRLRRQHGDLRLSPLFTSGPLWDLAGAGGEALVDVGRYVTIDAELQLPDISATPTGLRERIFEGWIDEMDWAGEDIELVCTDRSARLRDTWIERERVYGFAQGIAADRGVYVWRTDLHTLQVGDLVVPSDARHNGHFYRVSAASSPQALTEPTWPTGGGSTVVSGGVTFTESGAVDSNTGTAIETIIEQVLADNGLGGVTFYCPVSPSWNVKPYIQQRESVMDAIQAMVDQLGWWVRFEWEPSYAEYVLTLKDPGRTSSTVHRVMGERDEVECNETGVNVWSIRNVVRVVYSDSSTRAPDGSPLRRAREVSDPVSIARYGRRFMELAEGEASAIDTATEADRLAESCLADLADPTVGVSSTFSVDPYLELGDRITLPADALRWKAAQTLAIESLRHDFTETGARTSLTLRGKPASGRDRWLEKEALVMPYDVHDLTQMDNLDFASTSAAVIGGVSVAVGGSKAKNAHATAYDVHISPTPGFTPSAATLKASGNANRFDLPDLVPGKSYYMQVVPWARNASRIVRGSPSAEQSFVAGRAKAGHYDSTATQSHLPLNGNFEHATDDITTAPPDHWGVVALGGESESYGASGSVYSSIDSNKGRIINLRAHASQRGRVLSSPFEVRRGVRALNIYLSVRRLTGSGSGSPYDLLVDVFGFSDAALASLVINYTVTLSGSSSGAYPALNTWYAATIKFGIDYGALPDNVNFLQLALRRSTAGSTAVAWDIGDVYVQEADFGHAIIDQPAWTAVTFENSFSDYNTASHQPCAYLKDSMGFVHLRGLFKRASAALASNVFTLPSGFRPAKGSNFPAVANGKFARVEVDASGQVRVLSADDASWFSFVSLDGVTFDTR